MKLPRDVGGADLVKALQKLGYDVTRQTGSHVRMTRDLPSQHHVTILLHSPLRIGTLAAILADVGAHLKISRDELVRQLFDKH